MASRSIICSRCQFARWSVCRIALATLLALLMVASAVPSASAGSNAWTRLASAEKKVVGVTVAPSDPNLLLIRTPDGLLRSSDRGRTWTLVGPRLGRMMGDGQEGYWDPWSANLWLDPQDPQIVYSTLSVNGGGGKGDYYSDLYRSTDGGMTWTQVLYKHGGLAIYPGDPSIVYAAGDQGISKSTDRGVTWAKVLDRGDVGSVATHPRDPNVVLAAVGNPNDLGVLLVKSTDGGKSWSTIPNPVQGGPVYFTIAASSDVQSPASGSSGDVILAWGFTDLYRSVDGGTTWETLIPRSHSGQVIWVNPQNPAEISRAVEVEKGDPQTLGRSTDSGKSFTPFSMPPDATRVLDLDIDRGNPQTLYAVTDNGLWSYTFGEAPMSATDTVPYTDKLHTVILPSLLIVAMLFALSFAFWLVWPRLRATWQRRRQWS